MNPRKMIENALGKTSGSLEKVFESMHGYLERIDEDTKKILNGQEEIIRKLDAVILKLNGNK